MPKRNRCEEWHDLGLPCPYTLLEAVEKKKKKVREPVPDTEGSDELVKKEEAKVGERSRVERNQNDQTMFIGERNRPKGQGQVVSMEEWEALLLEIARRSAQTRIDMPVGVPVPQEIREEAIRQGARGRTLSLWIATVAAVLAVALAGGPGMASQLPQALQAINRARSVRPGGQLFNARAELDLALGELDRRLFDGGGSESYPWE